MWGTRSTTKGSSLEAAISHPIPVLAVSFRPFLGLLSCNVPEHNLGAAHVLLGLHWSYCRMQICVIVLHTMTAWRSW